MKKYILFIIYMALSGCLDAQNEGQIVSNIISSKYLENTGSEKTSCKISVYLPLSMSSPRNVIQSFIICMVLWALTALIQT